MKIITLLLLFGHAHDFRYHFRASLIVIVFNTLEYKPYLSHHGRVSLKPDLWSNGR